MKISTSVTFYDHTMASYPTSYKQCVVTPGKICIQFNKTQLKARDMPGAKIPLRRTHSEGRELPVDVLGTDVDCLAVGLPIELHFDFQRGLLKAYGTYISSYDSECMLYEFLKDYHEELGKMLSARNLHQQS